MSLEEKKYRRVETRLAKKKQKQSPMNAVLNQKLFQFEEKKFGIERSFSDLRHSKIQLLILRRMQDVLRRLYGFSHHRLRKLCGESSQAEQRLGQIVVEMILRQVSSSFHGHICDVSNATSKRKNKLKKNKSKGRTNPDTALTSRAQTGNVSSQVGGTQDTAVPERKSTKKKPASTPSGNRQNNSSRTVKQSESKRRGKTRSEPPVTVSRITETNPATEKGPWQTIQRNRKPKRGRRVRSSRQSPSHVQDKPGKLSSGSKPQLRLHSQPGVTQEPQKHLSHSTVKYRRKEPSVPASQKRVIRAKHDKKDDSASATSTSTGPKIANSAKQNTHRNNASARKQNIWPNNPFVRERRNGSSNSASKQKKPKQNNIVAKEKKSDAKASLLRERKVAANSAASKSTEVGSSNNAVRIQKVRAKNSAPRDKTTKATSAASKERRNRTSNTVARARKNGLKPTQSTEQKDRATSTTSTERENEPSGATGTEVKTGSKNNSSRQKNAKSRSSASKYRKAGPRSTVANARSSTRSNARQNNGAMPKQISARESTVVKSSNITSADSTHKLAAKIDQSSSSNRITQTSPDKTKVPSDTPKKVLKEVPCANPTNVPSDQRAGDVLRQERDQSPQTSLASKQSAATRIDEQTTGPLDVDRKPPLVASPRSTRSSDAVAVQNVSPVDEAETTPTDSIAAPCSTMSGTSDTKRSHSPSPLQNRIATVAIASSEGKSDTKPKIEVASATDTQHQTEKGSLTADLPVKPQVNSPTQFSTESQSWLPARQEPVYGPPLSFPGLPVAGAFPVPVVMPHLAHGYPPPISQAPPFGMCMPMYVLPPHAMNRPDVPIVTPVVYNNHASVATEPKSQKQHSQDTTDSILLPFMSIMMHSLYYIPAIREAVASKALLGKVHSVLVELGKIFDFVSAQTSPKSIPYAMCRQLWESLRKVSKMKTPSSTPDAWEIVLGALHSALRQQPVDDAAKLASTSDETMVVTQDVEQRDSNSAKRPISVERTETLSPLPKSFVSDIFHLNLVSKTDSDCPVIRKAFTFSVSTTVVQTDCEHASSFEDLLMRAHDQPGLLLDKVELGSPTAVFTLALIWPRREQMHENHTRVVLKNLESTITPRMFSGTGSNEAATRAALIVCHGFGAHSVFARDKSGQWLW